MPTPAVKILLLYLASSERMGFLDFLWCILELQSLATPLW
jgi:hypothetical protein